MTEQATATQVSTTTIQVGDKSILLETGRLAKQADGAVLVRSGDTMVLVTAVVSKNERNVDFFPLTVDVEEGMYAAGKIPGGFIKKEGRASEQAILVDRLTDRPFVRCGLKASTRTRTSWLPFFRWTRPIPTTSWPSWAPRRRSASPAPPSRAPSGPCGWARSTELGWSIPPMPIWSPARSTLLWRAPPTPSAWWKPVC